MNTIELKRDCDAIAIPSGIHQTLKGGTAVRILQARGGNYTVSTDKHAMYRIDGGDAEALGIDRSETSGSQRRQGPLTEQLVLDTLKDVFDPELPVNIVELGLIYSCHIADSNLGKSVSVEMGMTSPGCGMSDVLKADVESKLLRLPDVTDAHVMVVFDPPWSPKRMSEAARLQLGLNEHTPSLIQIDPSR